MAKISETTSSTGAAVHGGNIGSNLGSTTKDVFAPFHASLKEQPKPVQAPPGLKRRGIA